MTSLASRLLAGCDPEQEEAITTEAAPLLVLAGAGSGKTRVLTRRIAWRLASGSASAAHVLALTFTRKAAGELRSRLRSLGLPEGIRAGTFHAVALSELKRLAAERRQQPPVVLASKLRLLSEVTEAATHGRARGGRDTSASRNRGVQRRATLEEKIFPLAELAQEIEWAKSRCLGPSQYERAAALAGRNSSWPAPLVSGAFEAYELEKRRRRVLDFEDLLGRITDALEEDVEFGASARWRARHLFVDEYQDVNPAQLRFLKALVDEREDLFVVGDPHQAIYSWNGADPDAIRRFAEDFPGASVVELRSNYRSTREVLTVAGAVLGRRGPAPSASSVGVGPVPTLEAYSTDADEADSVAAKVRLAKRPGTAWSQIAVLARTNAQLEMFEAAMRRRRIPFSAPGDSRLFGSQSVQAAVREAGLCHSPGTLVGWVADLREAVRAAKAQSSIESPYGTSAPGVPTVSYAPDAAGSRGEPRDAVASDTAALETLLRMAEDYLAEDSSPNGTAFRNWLETMARSEDGGRSEDSVTLTTFHRAKGLEWRVVFVTGLEDGLVPIAYAKDPDALAEERRLLYVACTRAEEELHCSFARLRRFKGHAKPSERSPSPWVRAIEAAGQDLSRAAVSDRMTAEEAIATSRKLLHGP